MTLRYACGRCRKIITDVTPKYKDDGKIYVTLRCHGDSAEITLNPDSQGVLFSGRDALTINNRDPDAWADPDIPAQGLIDGWMKDI